MLFEEVFCVLDELPFDGLPLLAFAADIAVMLGVD